VTRGGQLWDKLRSWWAALGLWTGATSADERDFFTAVFTPPRVWDSAPLSQHPRTEGAPEGPYPAFQAAWQQLVLETLVVILGWRHSRYDPTRAWSDASAVAIHDASYQRVLALLAHRRTLDAQSRPLHALLLTDFRERIRDTPREAADPLPRTMGDIHILSLTVGLVGIPAPARLVPA
jgi:hypothetical protein